MSRLRERIKWWLFPGINLHARLREKKLPGFIGNPYGAKAHRVLDAGCGNGMLAYQAYLRGYTVLGISIKEGEIERNRRLFHEFLRIPEDRLQFRLFNLYDLDEMVQTFDEIICTEVLEHIADDRRIMELFHKKLVSDGVVHLCCPNAEHPDNARHALDHAEAGGHVRTGYTMESFRALLEPAGFRIETSLGLGGPIRQRLNKILTATQEKVGLPPALVLFLLFVPLVNLDSETPKVPYSLYVRARIAP